MRQGGPGFVAAASRSDGPVDTGAMFISGHEIRPFRLARVAHPDLTVWMQAAAPGCRDRSVAGAVEQAGVGVTAVGVNTGVSGDHLFPGGLARLVDGRIS